MENITIPVNISPEIMIALNETEQELKNHFQSGIAMFLFQEGKLTLGKAIQLSGLSRFEFEKMLKKNQVPISNLSMEQVISDFEKLGNL